MVEGELEFLRHLQTDECCEQCFGESSSSSTDVSETNFIRIAGWRHIADELERCARETEAAYSSENVKFQIVKLNTIHDLINEVVLDTKLLTGLYDGFVIPASATGELFKLRGLRNLDDLIDINGDNPLNVGDILLPYRDMMYFGTSQFMVPVMGNQVSLFYNKDILNAVNATLPKTWSEYISLLSTLSEAFPDKMADCTSLLEQTRCDYCQLDSVLHAIWASMTQGQGSSGLAGGGMFLEFGSVYPKVTLNPIFGSPFTEALNYLSTISKYSVLVDENGTETSSLGLQYDASVLGSYFDEGKCGMFIGSANHINMEKSFVEYTSLPGSTLIYNPASSMMETCTTSTCTGNIEMINSRSKLVNRIAMASYNTLFYGGISELVSKDKVTPLFDYFTNLSKNGNFPHSPIRMSQFQTADSSYVETVTSTLSDTAFLNNVINLRIPSTQELLDELLPYSYDAIKSHSETINTTNIETSWIKIFEANNSPEATATKMIVFHQKSQGTFVPKPQSKNYLSTALQYSGWALAGLGMLTSLYFAYWSYSRRNERVVRASQPSFLIMICVGVFIMVTSIIPMGIDNQNFSVETCDIACILIPWLYSIGFVISFSALFSKTWRVNKILNNPDKFRKLKVTPRDVIAPFIILMSINVIVLMVWTIVEPLKWEIKTKGDVDLLQLKEPETYGICVGESLERTLLFAGIIAAVDISSLVFANIQAYQCRNISVEYSESQWIAIAMVSIMQVLFIGIPLMVLVIDEPEPQFFVRVGIVFVTSMSTLLLIFLPKVKYNRDLKREKAERERARQMRSQESVINSEYSTYARISSVPVSTNSNAEDNESVKVGGNIDTR